VQACLDHLETTFFDIEMTSKVAIARTCGKTLDSPAGKPLANPEYAAALDPYVAAIFNVIIKLEKTFYDDDMTKRVKKVKEAQVPLIAAAKPITRPEMESTAPGSYSSPLAAYMITDVAYQLTVKNVLDKLESTFFDPVMTTLVSTAKASS
jgi:hypothetical protein